MQWGVWRPASPRGSLLLVEFGQSCAAFGEQNACRNDIELTPRFIATWETHLEYRRPAEKVLGLQWVENVVVVIELLSALGRKLPCVWSKLEAMVT